MGGRGARIKIISKSKLFSMSIKNPVLVERNEPVSQENISNKKSRKKYLKNIEYGYIGEVSDEIASRYHKHTGKKIDKNIARTSDRDAHVITHHSKNDLKVIKKNRRNILSNPDIVLYNKKDGGSLLYGKTINGKDYVIAIRISGNLNKNVKIFEATGFSLEKKIEKRYKKLSVLYKSK